VRLQFILSFSFIFGFFRLRTPDFIDSTTHSSEESENNSVVIHEPLPEPLPELTPRSRGRAQAMSMPKNYAEKIEHNIEKIYASFVECATPLKELEGEQCYLCI
jgi:hypothetical protein